MAISMGWLKDALLVGVPLITGAPAGIMPMRVPVRLHLPLNFYDGRVLTIDTPTGPVNARFEKIKELGVMACPDGFWCMQFKDWLNVFILVATVGAIIVGPIAAVKITLRHELRRELLRRKYETFHSLMKTRRVTLSGEHVSSLNVIQTEFHDDEKVIAAYKKYIDNLAGPQLAPGLFLKRSGSFLQNRDDVFNELMFEIGRNLGFTFDKRELSKYSYAPQGWVNIYF